MRACHQAKRSAFTRALHRFSHVFLNAVKRPTRLKRWSAAVSKLSRLVCRRREEPVRGGIEASWFLRPLRVGSFALGDSAQDDGVGRLWSIE